MRKDTVPRTVPPLVLAALEEELRKAEQALLAQEFEAAWALLTRAHVLGQAWNGPHARVHLGMIRWSIQRGAIGQFIKQTLILLSNPLATALVRRLVGSSGQNVNPRRRGPVPADLAQILREGVASVAESH